MDGTAAASNVACPATLKKVTIRYCVVARAYGLCVVAIFWGAMNVDRFEQHTFGKGRWSASLSGVARQGWPRLLLTSLALAACSQGAMAQTVAFQQTTAGAYSYTVPAGVTSVQVAIGGAGAGGGSGDFNGGNGGNGGAGAGVVATIAVTGGQTITGVVGAPGTGGVSAGPGAGGGAGGAGDGAGNRGGNTGGSGGNWSGGGGGGGGATVLQAGSSYVRAGGGGGGGGGSGARAATAGTAAGSALASTANCATGAAGVVGADAAGEGGGGGGGGGYTGAVGSAGTSGLDNNTAATGGGAGGSCTWAVGANTIAGASAAQGGGGGGGAGAINVGGTGVTAGSGSPGYVRIYFAGVSAAPVPTLGQWALAALSLLMMGFALQRRKIGFRRR